MTDRYLFKPLKKWALPSLLIGALLTMPTAAHGLAAGELADTHPVPADHLRIVTWNLEVFNQRSANPFHKANPNGPRTADQLDKLAARIIGFDAAIIALQEMNDVPALYDLRDRMNGKQADDGPWKTLALSDSTTRQQNAMLYDSRKVDLVSGEFAFSTPSAGGYPHEFAYRSPVTGLFSPKGTAETTFRVIGIHGS